MTGAFIHAASSSAPSMCGATPSMRTARAVFDAGACAAATLAKRIARNGERRSYGAFDAANAARLSMSSTLSGATTRFINSDHTPLRVPCCMSYICRTI